MTRAVRFLLISGLLVFVTGAVLITSQRSSSRKSLAAYKAELRAKGEKLTWAELGYPRPPDSSESDDRLRVPLSEMAAAKWHPGLLEMMLHVGPGEARVCWATSFPQFNPRDGKADSPGWEEFIGQFEAFADAIQAIREATGSPPRYFYNDPANWAPVTTPFVNLRNAAQWLGGDTIAALHAHDFDRARNNIHALARLTQFNQGDHSLVSQMIRVAIAGLGLSVTWEAVQFPGLTEDRFASLQTDWESVELLNAFEKGMVGNRAFVLDTYERLRALAYGGSTNQHPTGVEAGHKQQLLERLWNIVLRTGVLDADEQFFLEHQQKSLDIFRQLHFGGSMAEANRQLELQTEEVRAALKHPLARFRRVFSGIGIVNGERAASTLARIETQRRLTIAAIAIERYRLRHGQPPPELDALVPQFLSAVPNDLMSAKPLGYKLNPDGSFTLYSVGADGRDDGGDPNPANATNEFDLWTGRDAVWPKAVFETERVGD